MMRNFLKFVILNLIWLATVPSSFAQTGVWGVTNGGEGTVTYQFVNGQTWISQMQGRAYSLRENPYANGVIYGVEHTHQFMAGPGGSSSLFYNPENAHGGGSVGEDTDIAYDPLGGAFSYINTWLIAKKGVSVEEQLKCYGTFKLFIRNGRNDSDSDKTFNILPAYDGAKGKWMGIRRNGSYFDPATEDPEDPGGGDPGGGEDGWGSILSLDWWKNLCIFLFVPSEEDFDVIKASFSQFQTWGPFKLIADISSSFGTLSTGNMGDLENPNDYKIALGDLGLVWGSHYNAFIDLAPYASWVRIMRSLILGIFMIKFGGFWWKKYAAILSRA